MTEQHSAHRRPTVAIIGAGISGISAAHACASNNLPYMVFEKAADVGGVWRDNVYPGVGVDTPMGGYHLMFSPKYDWTHEYAKGSDIHSYLRKVVRDHDIRKNIRFGTSVATCEFESGVWKLTFDDGSVHLADAVIVATGFLRVPRLPAFAEGSPFEGASFHSSEWDRSLDPTGKRVGIVGTGSTGIQLTTALADMDCKVVQFIRTPQWMHTRPNRKVPSARRVLFKIAPSLAKVVQHKRARRLAATDPKLAKFGEWRRVPGAGRKAAQESFLESLELIGDPRVRELMTPQDPPGCKRIPLGSGYYEALNKSNVSVVRSNALNVTPNGIVDDQGTEHDLDVIVYATGFDSHAYFRPMTITGMSGQDLGQLWNRELRAFKSMMIPDFPSLFVLHGPYAPINSIPAPESVQAQISYVMKVLEFASQQGSAVHPTDAATDAHLDWIRASLGDTVWDETCDSWFRGPDGNPVVWPFGRLEHDRMYADVHRDDFALATGGSVVHELVDEQGPARTR